MTFARASSSPRPPSNRVDGPRSQRIEDRPLLGPPKPARSAERRGLLNSLGQENVGYGRWVAHIFVISDN